MRESLCLFLLGLHLLELLHESLGLKPFLLQKGLRLVGPLSRHFQVLWVLIELQSLNRRLNILFLDSSVNKELIVGPQLFDLDKSIDHDRLKLLLSHDHIHFLLCFELRLFQPANRIEYLLASQLLERSVSHLVSQSLNFLLELSSLLGLHHVYLDALFKDLLWHFQLLVQVSLDQPG